MPVQPSLIIRLSRPKSGRTVLSVIREDGSITWAKLHPERSFMILRGRWNAVAVEGAMEVGMEFQGLPRRPSVTTQEFRSSAEKRK